MVVVPLETLNDLDTTVNGVDYVTNLTERDKVPPVSSFSLVMLAHILEWQTIL